LFGRLFLLDKDKTASIREELHKSKQKAENRSYGKIYYLYDFILSLRIPIDKWYFSKKRKFVSFLKKIMGNGKKQDGFCGNRP